MRNEKRKRLGTHDRASRARAAASTATEACAVGDPVPGNAVDDPARSQPPESTDFFVFHQDRGRWAWQCLNEGEAVVRASAGTFGHYLHCVADARQHGWKGEAVPLFCAGCPT